MKYYDRKKEMNSLQELGRKYFIVLWGRRRIGKTSLALQGFPENSLYFFVGRKSTGLLLEEFTEIIRKKWKYVPTFRNWEEFFRYLFAEYRGTIILDEFQNFRFVDKSLFSTLQNILDSTPGNYKMVAIGSYVGMMKHIFMDAKEPLYGRTTGVMKIHPLDFSTTYEILDDLGIRDFDEKVSIYSIFGGVPYYYSLMENYGVTSYREALDKLIFGQLAPLKYEVKNILLEEFGKSYSPYFSILQSIALGKTTLTAISDKSGVVIQSISKYLKELADVYDLIERIVPVDGGRRGIYSIKDPFTRFWFRYVESNLSDIEGGYGKMALEKVVGERTMIASREFESIIRELLRDGDRRVEKWWNRLGEEIDAVAKSNDGKEVTFAEVKWTGKMIGTKELTDLKAKAAQVKKMSNKRKKYLLVSKSGFREMNYGDDVLLWDKQDVEERIRRIVR